MFSTQRHFPSILWEQKAFFLTVYRWLAKNKQEVWAWLSRTAAENSNPWLQACLFPLALLWKMQEWGMSQANGVQRGHNEEETFSHFCSPLFESWFFKCYHFWKLFSVWVPAVISWAAMCFFELEGGWMNDDMKMIACICVVCTEMYQSLQWIMHVPLPLDFCSVGFHFLCVFCRTKAGFPNFLGSQNASSIIIKNCVEEHRITGSSKARLAPNPCVVSVCIGKGWNKVTYKVSCTSPVIRANCSVPPGSFLTRNRY